VVLSWWHAIRVWNRNGNGFFYYWKVILNRWKSHFRMVFVSVCAGMCWSFVNRLFGQGNEGCRPKVTYNLLFGTVEEVFVHIRSQVARVAVAPHQVVHVGLINNINKLHTNKWSSILNHLHCYPSTSLFHSVILHLVNHLRIFKYSIQRHWS